MNGILEEIRTTLTMVYDQDYYLIDKLSREYYPYIQFGLLGETIDHGKDPNFQITIEPAVLSGYYITITDREHVKRFCDTSEELMHFIYSTIRKHTEV